MKYTYIATVLACALTLSACNDSSQEEQREEELRTPVHTRTNSETGMSIADIINQLQKYASLGEIRYNEATQSSYTEGGSLLVHYNLMSDGLETITDYPYIAVVMGLATENGPSSLPKEKYLKTLLAAGASPNGYYGERSALTYAAKYGLDGCVRILLEAGADMNASKAALKVACTENYLGCVKLLLDAGADVNTELTSFYGHSLMAWATGYGNMDCVRLLHESGRVNSKQYGEALKAAITCNDPDKVRQILDTGGATAESCSEALLKELDDKHSSLKLEIVEMLLKAGADSNAVDSNGCSALSKACDRGNSACVKLLLEAGADVHKPNNYGSTPLIYAKYDPSCMQLLLDAGADVNVRNKGGVSALYEAVSHNRSKSVKLLADTGKLDRELCTQVMLKVLADETQYDVDPDCIQFLLDAGADPNAKDSEGYSALILACKLRRDKIVRILLRNGAEVNATGPGKITALMMACKKGHFESVEALLEAKANVHLRSERGMTAIDYTTLQNCEELLRAAGAVKTNPPGRW